MAVSSDLCQVRVFPLGLKEAAKLQVQSSTSYLPNTMAMGPAATAPARPPRGNTDTVKDQSSRTMPLSRGAPVRSNHVLFMNVWMYCKGRTVLCDRGEREACECFCIHLPVLGSCCYILG